MKGFMRETMLLGLLALLQGCATYPAVGTFKDYNEVMVGEVSANLVLGGGSFKLKGEVTGVTCEGKSYVTKGGFTCEGQAGDLIATCSDSRTLRAYWEAESCVSGHGEGRDSEGNTFAFRFGGDVETAKARLAKEFADSASLPRLPTPAETAQMVEDAQACYTKLEAGPEMAPVRDKISFGASNAPFEVLTDTSKPTDAEKAAISFWAKGREVCAGMVAAANQRLRASRETLTQMNSANAEMQSMIAQLYLGNMTYGAFAAKQQEIAIASRQAQAAMRARDKNEKTRLELQQERMAVGRGGAEAMAVVNSVPRPAAQSKTTCSVTGNTVFCN